MEKGGTPKDPEEIFEIQERIGEGWRSCDQVICRSYGSVFKAQHKSTQRTVAIKIIPVETDLQDLMKEISILKSCRSDYIVRYYGSYYKDNDLWVGSTVSAYRRLLWSTVAAGH